MTWSHPAFEAVADLVRRRAGLAFPPPRREGAELGIRRAMGRAGVADPAGYHARLAADPGALDDLLTELTVGETYFFREPAQFDFLRREVLPDVLRRRGPNHGLRAWSAGCASGEEAYSLAILFDQEGWLGRAHLLGTDVSRAALARARQAVYGDWSLRGPGAAAVAPYLTPAGKRFRLAEKIRRAVGFEYLNLALDAYPSLAVGVWALDVILCRNVLIYFDPETAARVVRRLFEALAEGGWLITASSDPPLEGKAPFEVVVAPEGVFYRRPLAHEPRPGGKPAGTLNEILKTPPAFSPSPTRGEGEEGTAGPLPAGSSLVPGLLAEARGALARGDYDRAAELTEGLGGDAAAAALHVRALANREAAEAERACAAAVARHPLAAELSYLHAVLLLELGRVAEAERAARRVIYLDRTLAAAHFTLGSVLRRRGDRAGARRAYQNARDLCAAVPPDREVPLADGEHAGRLAEAAEFQLALLGKAPG